MVLQEKFHGANVTTIQKFSHSMKAQPPMTPCQLPKVLHAQSTWLELSVQQLMWKMYMSMLTGTQLPFMMKITIKITLMIRITHTKLHGIFQTLLQMVTTVFCWLELELGDKPNLRILFFASMLSLIYSEILFGKIDTYECKFKLYYFITLILEYSVLL